jgi:hypothetical protein
MDIYELQNGGFAKGYLALKKKSFNVYTLNDHNNKCFVNRSKIFFSYLIFI